MKKKRVKPVRIKLIHRRLHEEITEEQTAKLREVYVHVGRAFYKNTFEQFERGFLFVSDIDRDIKWWMAMSSVAQQCLRRFPNVDSDALAIATVLVSLCGGADASSIPVEALQYLKENVPSRCSLTQPTS
ncbi:hypothetical protein GC197_14380 [bacterium]|nr:hypothetical protein [bacterium]